MKFLTLVWKNLARRRLRSSLTVFAVAIAVAAVVALVGIAVGFERSFLRMYESAGVDLIVCRAGLRQRMTSTIDDKVGNRIAAIEGVQDVIPGLVDVVSFEEAGLYGVVIQGWNPESLVFDHIRLIQGRSLQLKDKKTVLIGSVLAANLGKTPGDSVEVFEGEAFQVVGIFESSNVFENGCMIVPLGELQRLMDRPHQVTGFSVILKNTPQGKPVDQVRGAIEGMGIGLTALPAQEHVQTLTEIRAAKAMAWLTSAVALLIGTAGMLNTMLMSVYERTTEIGILRAIGWRKSRIIKLILSESVLLSVIGACVGTVAAVAVVWLLTRLPAANGLIDGQVPLTVIGQGFIVALFVGLFGGLLSAFRAAKMLPMDALRHQ